MNFDRLGTDDGFNDASNGLTDDQVKAVDHALAEEFGIRGGGKSSRRIGDGTIAALGALILAGGALMGMRWLGSQHAFLAHDASIEARVTAFLDHIVSGSDGGLSSASTGLRDADIADLLDDDRTVAQVPLEMVKKNPFLLIEEASTTPVQEETVPVIEDEFARRRREAMKRYSQLDDFATDIRVSSIMGREGDRVAIVEGQVVKVGDQIEFDTGEVFNIVRINSFDVIIESEGFEFMIDMKRQH